LPFVKQKTKIVEKCKNFNNFKLYMKTNLYCVNNFSKLRFSRIASNA